MKARAKAELLRAALSFGGAAYFAGLAAEMARFLGVLGWLPLGFTWIFLFSGFEHVGRVTD